MYVLVEGIDGSGKSMVAKHIAQKARALPKPDHLSRAQLDVFHTFEPTAGPLGKQARSKIETGDYKDPSELVDIFISDREQHFKNFLAAKLGHSDLVIQDRGFLSTASYNTQNQVQAVEIVKQHSERDWFRFPNMIILLTCNPHEAVSRLKARGKITSVEKAEFLEGVQHRYASAAQASLAFGIGTLLCINTTETPLDLVLRRAWTSVECELRAR